MTARRASYAIHIVPMLRWERERATHQISRLELVALFDRILDVMETDARARYLTLGGETVILEDYLALRPERYEQIEALIHDGRLIIGPLFIQTDPALNSPEVLIRNLLHGAAMGKVFDHPVNRVAYFPVGGGLPAQLPQILRGFDLAGVVVGRGYEPDAPEWMWFAPDGSRIIAATAGKPFPELADARDQIAERTRAADLLAIYPLDHDDPGGTPFAALLDQHLPAAIQQTPDTFFKSTLAGYFENLRDLSDLHGVQGEQRSPKHTLIGQGTLTAQLPIKRRNLELETLLTRWAEPFTAWAEHYTRTNPRSALHLAWRTFLENQTPEILAGSIIDSVQPDIIRRFYHAAQIGEWLTERALKHITAGLGSGTTDALAVFNPSPFPRTDLVIVGGESYIVEDVPPFGCVIVPDARPIRRMPLPQNADLTIENEFLRVQVDPFGPVINLTDKVRDVQYRRGMAFLCEGDQGDVYNFDPIGRGIQNARRLYTDDLWSIRTPDYERLHYTVLITLDPAPEMEPPPGDKALTDLRVGVELRLIRGVARLECTVTIHNTLKNYRVRACFTVPFPVDEVTHDTPFEIVTRPVRDLPPVSPPEGYAEAPPSAFNTRSFLRVINPDTPHNGLLVAQRGLPEMEIIRDEEERPMIALTLLRSVAYAHKLGVRTRGQDSEGQDRHSEGAIVSDAHSAQFALIPTDESEGFEGAIAYTDGVLRGFVTQADQPVRQSLITSSDARFQISAIKLPEAAEREGLIVRGWNTGDHDVEVRLTPFRRFAYCDVVRMDEHPTGGRLAIERDGSFTFDCSPHRVLTFWLHD
jgi:mannosylglycerate hydrolase